MTIREWTLNNGHKENNTSGLLSEKLLQDHETLLSIMMDNSLKSCFKQMKTVKKVKSKTKTNNRKKLPKNSSETLYRKIQNDSPQWKTINYLTDETEIPPGYNSKSNKTGKRAAKVQAEHKRPFEKKTLRRGPWLKTWARDFSNQSQRNNSLMTVRYTQPLSDSLVKVPESLGCEKTVVKFKIPKGGKANLETKYENPEKAYGLRVNKMPKENPQLDNETDGYYSDAEMTDSEDESSKARMQVSQFEPSNVDIVRMSIFAS